jgi:hypothetical protein
MPPAPPAVSRRSPELPRLDPVVTPRWLRERRRAQARAAHTAAATIAEEMLRRSLPGRELTLDEIIRVQGVKPFNWDEFRRQDSGLRREDWAELRAALGLGDER